MIKLDLISNRILFTATIQALQNETLEYEFTYTLFLHLRFFKKNWSNTRGRRYYLALVSIVG